MALFEIFIDHIFVEIVAMRTGDWLQFKIERGSGSEHLVNIDALGRNIFSAPPHKHPAILQTMHMLAAIHTQHNDNATGALFVIPSGAHRRATKTQRTAQRIVGNLFKDNATAASTRSSANYERAAFTIGKGNQRLSNCLRVGFWHKCQLLTRRLF